MSISPTIFREYDIRGRVQPGELDETAIIAIADAFSIFLKVRLIDKIVIGYDNRKISPVFAKLAAKVFVQAGFTVYDLGMCITPAAYFAQYHLGAEGLMMITASHNPDGWCGCKLGHGYSTTLGPEEIKELAFLVSKQTRINYPIDEGHIEEVDIRPAYLADILSKVQLPPRKEPLRVVVDAGNGAAGIYAWELFQRLGCLTFPLYCDPDDTYPHYFPNPSELKARKRLREMVLHRGIQADIGMAFDGDGDRIGVIDEQGNNIWSDRLLMLLARPILAEVPGSNVVFDVKCTQALPEDIAAHGGNPIMWKTGHSHIKQKLKDCQGVLAGERSGHIFIQHGGYGYDDALLAAAHLCKILAASHQPLSQLLQEYPCYQTSPEIKIPWPDEEKYQLVAKLQQYFLETYGQERVNTINGARVSFPELHGWALIRASSNLPELVIVLEGDTQEHLAAITKQFKQELAKFQIPEEAWQNETTNH